MGLFEMAEKGTLFLDEIGELQLHTQVKLLRVLDGQPFYRLGGHRKIKVDVRIVAATNQDLEAAVKEGSFRKDLFHRLGQFQLRVPPLRERPEDIVALAEHFLSLKAAAKHFTAEAISVLLSHAWPGNIRELRNLVAKVAMESPAAEVDASRINASLSGAPASIRQTASTARSAALSVMPPSQSPRRSRERPCAPGCRRLDHEAGGAKSSGPITFSTSAVPSQPAQWSR